MRQRKMWLLEIALLLSGLAVAQQEVTLRLCYQPGQTLVYKITLDGTVNLVSEIGVATDLRFKGKLTQEQVVREVGEDGRAVVLVTVTGEMELLSPAEGTQPSMQKVLPTKVLLTIMPDGRVVEIKRVREEGEKSESSDEQMKLMQDPFQALTMGAEAISLLPSPLPPKPIKVGETWDLTGTVPVPVASGQPVSANVIGQGKLLAIERKEDKEFAVTEVQTEVPKLGDVVTKMLPLKEMGIEMEAKGGNKTIAKNWYDLSQGLLTKREVSSETKMTVVISMPANVGGGVMSLQSHTKLKSVTELVEVKPKAPAP